MPEEFAPRRAPSCALTGLPGSSITHPEGLSSSAQAAAGTGHPGVCSGRKKATPLTHYSTVTRSLLALTLFRVSATCCFSSVRDFQPRPDLVSAVGSLPEINSKKLLSSQRQRRLLKVTLNTRSFVSHPVVVIQGHNSCNCSAKSIGEREEHCFTYSESVGGDSCKIYLFILLL